MRSDHLTAFTLLVVVVAGGCATPARAPSAASATAVETILSPGQAAGYMLSLRRQMMASMAATASGDDDLNLSWLPHGLLLLRVASDSMFRAAAPSLHQAGRALLQGLAHNLSSHPATIVHILVYTDAAGRTFFNHTLSRRRAETITAYLQAFGVPSRRISASGRGERQPIASNDSAAGRRRNRRVDIVIAPLIKGKEGLAYRTPREPLP